MIINKEEIEEIEDFMKTYSHFHEELNEREKQVIQIFQEIERLKECVGNLRSLENSFYERLTKKYGPGKLNTQEKIWEEIL